MGTFYKNHRGNYKRLKDWYDALGEYRQLQLQQKATIDDFLGPIFTEFCGTADHYVTIFREEYLQMKCCSFKPKDLEKHYDGMSRLHDVQKSE